MNRAPFGSGVGALLLLSLIAGIARAQIRASPSSVNVSSQAPTTAFITFSGLRSAVGGAAGSYVPADAFWCGTLIAAVPDRGQKCDPSTLYGRVSASPVPPGSVSAGSFTDIMSTPASVARRAYQAAQGGKNSAFYYVRRFVSTANGPDAYAFVTLRPTSGGAGAPFALTDVIVAFAVETPILFVRTGARPPPISALIRYTGTGRLKGRWEIVLPGEELPAPRDLLTEATLPVAERGTQRRYSELARFNVFLPPTGRYTLKGPDVSRLPTRVDGRYLVLLRIEASDDPAGDSQSPDSQILARPGAVAGFPLPVLRYFVGTAGSELSASRLQGSPAQLLPAADARLDATHPLDFTWMEVNGSAFYRLEVEREDGTLVLSAIVADSMVKYRAPPWLTERAGTRPLRWRVAAFDSAGRTLGSSSWRRLLPAAAGGR